MIVSNDMMHDSRVDRHAKALGAIGHDVTVLCQTSATNLPRYERREHYEIIRDISYHALVAREVLRAKRKVGYLSEFLRWGRIGCLVVLARLGLYELALRRRADVYYSNDPDILDIGVMIKIFWENRGRPQYDYGVRNSLIALWPMATPSRGCPLRANPFILWQPMSPGEDSENC